MFDEKIPAKKICIKMLKQTNKIKWKWHTAKYCNPYSEFVLCIYPYKVHTHSSEHTPRAVGSHLCYSARGAVGGSVPCSRATSVVVLRVERALVIHSPPHLQFLPARDSNSQPFAYESDSLTIRPRLPQETTLTIIHDGTYLLKLT